MPWDKAGSNYEDKRPQQGQDEFSGEDAHTLDTEEASKTGPEERTQDEANEAQQTKEQEDKARAGKLANNLGRLATGVNKS
ncbi:MAG: hypothetical protein PHY54_10415 [Methylococcales bacterium]|nr:hypothetical protein [Methylococcales bacterium]